MIARLSGTLAGAEAHALVIDAHGVGYRVFTTNDTIRTALANRAGPCSLWTHLAVRENALDLYGFVERTELDFFVLLLSVSGIGPKSALAILNLAPGAIIRQAIAGGDASYLTKVSGIGKKNAQKIVLELKDKLGPDVVASSLSDTDALEALESLGYPLARAREALQRASPEITTVEARIKFALRELGNAP